MDEMPSLEKYADEVHPSIFDESMSFGEEEIPSINKIKVKAFDKMLMTDVMGYTGAKLRMKKEDPSPRARTPEPEKRTAPRPVFR